MKQRVGSLFLALALLLSIASAGRATAAESSFVLVNKGSGTIYHVYLSRAGDNVWSNDFLGTRVLSPGYQITLSFNSGFDTCHWDVAAVYSDGHTSYDWDEDLCTYGTIDATY